MTTVAAQIHHAPTFRCTARSRISAQVCALVILLCLLASVCTPIPRFHPVGLSILSKIARGRGTETCSRDFYNIRSPPSPARQVRDWLNFVFPSWNNHLPPDDLCCLTATHNVFGRLVNAAPGATDASVCTTETHCGDVSGEFVHIEQKAMPRWPIHYDRWARAIRYAFHMSSCTISFQNNTVDPGDLVV
jgi:hypothetical protein